MKLFIGLVLYEDSTAKYLPVFLPSLNEAVLELKIAYPEVVVSFLAYDNSRPEIDSNRQFLQNSFSEVEILSSGVNLGFGAAYNRLIQKAINDGAEYFLMVNPDTSWSKDALKILFNTLLSSEKIAAVAPRLLRWDFAEKELTNIIDSDGIGITKGQRFYDRHQGETLENYPLFLPESIFGVSGAAALFKLSALKAISFSENNYLQYFDELFFMYKEDIDLSYRLRLAGFDFKLEPRALVYHDRSVASVGSGVLGIFSSRFKQNQASKYWSLWGQMILYFKYKKLPYSLAIKFRTCLRTWGLLVFALVFEIGAFQNLGKFGQALAVIKKRSINHKMAINAKEIEVFMSADSGLLTK